jgi:nicotinamide-nucleotide amidase
MNHFPDSELVADDLEMLSARLLAALCEEGATIAVGESCTGGLLAAHLTDIEGYGRCFDRGFVTYTEEAKRDLLGIELIDLRRHGAVSAEIAKQMVQGALAGSKAELAVSITGFAGGAGPRDEEGLVFLAAKCRKGNMHMRECHFGALGRERVRALAVRGALELAITALEDGNKDAQP